MKPTNHNTQSSNDSTQPSHTSKLSRIGLTLTLTATLHCARAPLEARHSARRRRTWRPQAGGSNVLQDLPVGWRCRSNTLSTDANDRRSRGAVHAVQIAGKRRQLRHARVLQDGDRKSVV